MLEWKCVKAFVNSFEAEEFAPIVQSVRKLLKAGVDPAERDRESKTAAHYLAEWKYLKEKVDDPKNSQLPKRARELLEEIGYKECKNRKIHHKKAPSLLDDLDENGNTFLHSLVRTNFRENLNEMEKSKLNRVVQKLVGTMKSSDAAWAATSKAGKTVKSLCEELGLSTEQKQSEKNEKNKKSAQPKFPDIQYQSSKLIRTAKLSPVQRKNSVEEREPVPKPARRVSLKPNSPARPIKKTPERSARKREKSPAPPPLREESPRNRRRRKHSSLSEELTDSELKSVDRKQKSAKEKESRKQPSDAQHFTDQSEEETNDMLEIGVTADDFIEDAIQLIPKSKRSKSKQDSPRPKKSHRRSRQRSATPKKRSPVRRSRTSPARKSRYISPSPVRVISRSPTPKRAMSRSPTPRRRSSLSEQEHSPVNLRSQRLRQKSPPRHRASPSPPSQRRAHMSPSPRRSRDYAAFDSRKKAFSPRRRDFSPRRVPKGVSPPRRRQISRASLSPVRRQSPKRGRAFQPSPKRPSPAPRSPSRSPPQAYRLQPSRFSPPVRKSSPSSKRSPRIKDSRSSFVMHEKRRGKIDRKDYARKGEMSMSPIRTDKADWGQKANEKRSQIDDSRSRSRSPSTPRNFERKTDQDFRNSSSSRQRRSRSIERNFRGRSRSRSRPRDNKFMRLANY